mmetsp:Transcript_14626/g.36784  ORF Transcript_14626/g.36784 Transcript_14626/m.36784 type:complete len:273 (+) Transcript_14626:377-1195(+)
MAQRISTDVAHFRATSARHFVASIQFDKFFVALGAGPHLGLAQCLLDLETSLVSSILHRDLLASQWNVRLLAAFSTGDKMAVFDGTLENVLRGSNFGLVSTLGAHGQVASETRKLELGLYLHFRIFLPCFGRQGPFQLLLAKARIATASLAALEFQIGLFGHLVDSQISGSKHLALYILHNAVFAEQVSFFFARNAFRTSHIVKTARARYGRPILQCHFVGCLAIQAFLDLFFPLPEFSFVLDMLVKENGILGKYGCRLALVPGLLEAARWR